VSVLPIFKLINFGQDQYCDKFELHLTFLVPYFLETVHYSPMK